MDGLVERARTVPGHSAAHPRGALVDGFAASAVPGTTAHGGVTDGARDPSRAAGRLG